MVTADTHLVIEIRYIRFTIRDYAIVAYGQRIRSLVSIRSPLTIVAISSFPVVIRSLVKKSCIAQLAIDQQPYRSDGAPVQHR